MENVFRNQSEPGEISSVFFRHYVRVELFVGKTLTVRDEELKDAFVDHQDHAAWKIEWALCKAFSMRKMPPLRM